MALAICKRKDYSVIEPGEIRCIKWISKPSWRGWREKQLYKESGINLILGEAFNLEIQLESKTYPLIIKNIRSFEDYENLYEEIGELADTEIMRNIRSWEERLFMMQHHLCISQTYTKLLLQKKGISASVLLFLLMDYFLRLLLQFHQLER